MSELNDPKMQKSCGYCGRNVFDPQTLTSDRLVFCDKICEAEYKFEARKVLNAKEKTS